ncbi:MAG: CHAD domain-containing protein, partial [Ignavibacteriales bacterium]|nr:CHAD domain-containing protein [Ignavibacteriales bacterium]
AKAAGLEPGGYDSKVRLRLRPDDPARVSVVAILRRLAEHARANEEGTVADLDPEFLHDYRVSLRRTRAALSQLKTVFRPEEIDRFRSGFKNLGDLTNPARDLDVFLLERDAYRRRLPERLAPGLARLFDRSEKERAAAKRKIARRLRSAAHRRFFDSWLLFLERPFPEDAPEDARLPTVGYASRKIRRRYRNALKIGEAMIAEGPGPAMHRLRLECKKLRYLLEFFRSLYPKKNIGALVARLKALQDALGVYNDFLVQEERMSELLADVRDDDAETAAAIGAMLAAAHQRQAGAVRDYEREFARFAAKKTRAGFDDLFRQPTTSVHASV